MTDTNDFPGSAGVPMKDGNFRGTPGENGKDPLIKSIVAEFEGKFVVDEGSMEFKDDEKMGWADDTRLIADYVDGKTLTAKMITDFLREKLTHIRTLSIAEGERKAAESIKQQILNASYLVEGSWKHEYVRGLGAAEKIAADYLKQASHPSYEK